MKKFIAVLVAFIPFGVVRIFLYRSILGYKISYSAKIGPFNYIFADSCFIGQVNIGFFNYFDVGDLVLNDGVIIGRFNRFRWISKLLVGAGSVIRGRNSFFGTKPGISPFKTNEQMTMGQSCIVTNRHQFDLSEAITIGDDVTIGGADSQFWTHGFDLEHTKIQAGINIGDRVYIGSRVMVLQLVSIASDVVVGAGTVVSKSISESGFYVSSAVVRKSDVPCYKNSKSLVNFNGYGFLRKDFE